MRPRPLVLGAAAAAVAGALYWASRRRRRRAPKLVLHFDVNETIMVGDPAGGDSFEDCLNKMICKNAFVRARAAGADPRAAASVAELTWWDGTPLDAAGDGAPALVSTWEWPEGCCPFYQVVALKRFAKRFTEPPSPGRAYRAVFEKLEAALRVPEPQRARVDPRLCHDGVHWFLVPAFFHTLRALHAAGRDFAVVVRTFGTDGPNVARALEAWAGGRHPSLGGVPALAAAPVRVWRIRFADDGGFALTPEGAADGAAAEGALAEEDALAMMEARGARGPTAAVCADDYNWWASHGESAAAGKPMWLTLADEATHHIFFDDNIRNHPTLSIVATRVRRDAAAPFAPASGEATRALHGLFIVRCPTFEAVLDPDWFLKHIDACTRARAGTRWQRARARWMRTGELEFSDS